MSTTNPFDLLLDNENEDISLLIETQQKKLASIKTTSLPPAKLPPSKPLPLSQPVRESRPNAAQTRDGIGRGRGGRGHKADFENGNYVDRYGGFRGGFATENGDGGNVVSERGRGSFGQYRGSVRGGRRGGGYAGGSGENGFDSERPQRRVYERRSGTGAGNEMKREGAGRGNWGTMTDDILAQETEGNVNVDEMIVTTEKQAEHGDGQGSNAIKDKKDEAANEVEKEPEDNEMTLEEYEKIREEKRKALLSIKPEERKVEIDKDFHSMQQLTVKKESDPIFIKLGSDKDTSKLRENSEREERARKVMSINEFLKPAEGEKYYSPGVRGRGRGRGDRDRGSFRGGFASAATSSPTVPAIEDQRQFPILGVK